MAPAIMILMFAAAGVNMLLFRASAAETIKTSIMSAGTVALISIAGLGWLGSSFFEGNKQVIVGSISGAIHSIRGFSLWGCSCCRSCWPARRQRSSR